MDMNTIIAGVGGLVLGIGAIATALSKFVPKVARYVRIASEAISLVEKILKAVEPDADGKVTLTTEEVAAITKEAMELKAALKA